jgi:CubicO group peptidase (beta-lactamase class C family)
MQLAEAGRISLDAPVQEYLPWFEVDDRLVPAAASTITVRHLLNNTSGIPTGKIIGASLTGNANETAEEAVRALKEVAPTTPAGTAFQYSNSNYVILGLVVQTVSGQSYESYVQERIFAPLRMQQSFVSESEALRHNMATGYRWWFGLPIPANVPHPTGTAPAPEEKSAATTRLSECAYGSGAATALGNGPAARALHRLPVSGADKLAAHVALLS